ncbi:MAG: aldose 1-epimerase family protein [Bacilli bacterium]|nr:aldose 1-epimerase family protein [Bacilli bacterium]
MNPYLGNDAQCAYIEEHRLVEGKGAGMRLYEINNGNGLFMVLSPDRNMDIARLSYRGINLSYFSPCGYVAPAFYEGAGTNWLKSFTAGFLTTCGLEAVGSPCVDEGEVLPLHGSIANRPCEHSYFLEKEDCFEIHSLTKDETIFGRKLTLNRTIVVSKVDASFTIEDVIENRGDQKSPVEVLYHMNMGYPLLDEDSVIDIPSSSVKARDAHAQTGIQEWMKMQKPTPGYQEMCYYHTFEGEEATVSIHQPKNGITLSISANPKILDALVEWKMMGVRDYVLGLEFGNAYPDGRDQMRKQGMLKFLEPNEKLTYRLRVEVRKQ